MADAIRDLIGEAPLAPGKVKLELPSIVENGNTVPLAVSVESPMTEADHVDSIHIFNQKNPQPYVAAFHLGPQFRVAVRHPAVVGQRGDLRVHVGAPVEHVDEALHKDVSLQKRLL